MGRVARRAGWGCRVRKSFLDFRLAFVHDPFVPGAVTAPELSQRLTLIVDLLRRHLAAHASRDRAFGPLLLILWNRLSRTLARVAAIAQRHHAGTLRKPRTRSRRPAPAPASGDPLPRKPPPRDPLPRARAWLLRRVPLCVSYGEYLRLLLEEPEMAAFIEAAPQLRPLLRPLWRMLRAEPPPALLRNPAPPRPRKPRRKIRRRPRRAGRRTASSHNAAASGFRKPPDRRFKSD